jgi:hypothetical protein
MGRFEIMPLREYECTVCKVVLERREYPTGIYGKMECCNEFMKLLVSAHAKTAKQWEV